MDPGARDAIKAGCEFVLSNQNHDGTWSGSANPDIRTTAEYICMCAWFGTESTEQAQHCVEWLRDAVQNMDIQNYLDVGALVLVRLALHLCGEATKSGLSQQLDARIQLRGSQRRADNVARIYLAIFNQISFAECDALPPEIVMLPVWAPASLAAQDRWSRALRVPLSVLTALHPRKISVTPVGKSTQPALRPPRRLGPEGGMTLSQRICMSVLRLGDALGLSGLHNSALRRARQWMVTRISAQSGVAGSMSATALSAIALSCLGCERTSPAVERCFEALHRCQTAQGGVAARAVPNFETALAISSLAATGISYDAPAVNRAVEAVLDREVARQGDWSQTVDAEPGGWSSEHENDLYPDVACTAATLVALRALFAASPASRLVTDDSMVAMIRANSLNLARERIAVLDRVAAASRRARRWVVAMQRTGGSWSSVDASVTWYATGQCDQRHLTVATTGLVLQALGRWEMRLGQTTVDRAVTYLRLAQSKNGLWPSGGTFDYYTTWMAIEGMLAVGVTADDTTIRKAAAEVAAAQNGDGSFSQPGVPQRDSSTLCTSWALLTLMAAQQNGDPVDKKVVDHAAAWLLDRQLPSGEWRVDEGPEFSALGPQAVAETTYSIYALLAVARWAEHHSA